MRTKKKLEANDSMFDESDSAPAGMGHNRGGVVGQDLRNYIERIEKLDEEKAGIAEDIRDVFAEAKANGFDTKIMRQVIKIRRMAKHEREEQEAMLDTYLHALGMIPDFD